MTEQKPPVESTREFPRHDWAAPIQSRCEDWEAFLELYSLNISHGGLFLQSEQLPDINTAIEIHISMPNRKVLNLHGRVAHHVSKEKSEETGHPAGFGIEFTGITEEQRGMVSQLVRIAERHQANPPPPTPGAAATSSDG